MFGTDTSEVKKGFLQIIYGQFIEEEVRVIEPGSCRQGVRLGRGTRWDRKNSPVTSLDTYTEISKSWVCTIFSDTSVTQRYRRVGKFSQVIWSNLSHYPESTKEIWQLPRPNSWQLPYFFRRLRIMSRRHIFLPSYQTPTICRSTVGRLQEFGKRKLKIGFTVLLVPPFQL